MSFDPQNPRAAPRPTPPSSIPPQPINQRQPPSRNVLLAAGIVGALILLGILLLLLNLTSKPATSPAPSTIPRNSAAPTTAGSPRSSSVPSTAHASTGIPTFVPTPVAASPGTPEADLLARIPAAIAATCITSPGTGDVSVTASCTADAGAISVKYDQYGSLDPMNAAYAQVFAAAQIDPNSGSCEDVTTWPAESAYDVQGTPVGRRFCTNASGSPTIHWTDERLNIFSTASGADAAGLLDFWTNEAGPVPTP